MPHNECNCIALKDSGCNVVSISPKFYGQLFCSKVFGTEVLISQFVLLYFLQWEGFIGEIDYRLLHNYSFNLTPSLLVRQNNVGVGLGEEGGCPCATDICKVMVHNDLK